MVEVIFKDETVKVVNKKQFEFLMSIKNAKRDQIFTYRYL